VYALFALSLKGALRRRGLEVSARIAFYPIPVCKTRFSVGHVPSNSKELPHQTEKKVNLRGASPRSAWTLAGRNIEKTGLSRLRTPYSVPSTCVKCVKDLDGLKGSEELNAIDRGMGDIS
jgi:hypothetical protein